MGIKRVRESHTSAYSGQTFVRYTSTMTGIVRDTRTQNGVSSPRKCAISMATMSCRECLSRIAALHKIGVCAGFFQANGGSVQSLQEADLSDQEGTVASKTSEACNRVVRFSMR